MDCKNCKIIERVAFCSLFCAGFSYMGYTIMKNVCSKKFKGKKNKLSQTYLLKIVQNQSTQTESFPECKNFFDEASTPSKSVKDRIHDLNQSERQRKRSIPISPEVKTYNFHGSSWTSPLGSAKFLSVSAENINLRLASPPEKLKMKSVLSSSHFVLDKLQSKLLNLEFAEEMCADKVLFEDDTIYLKSLINLQKSPSQMTSFEVKNLVHLLHSSNEDIILKTLCTISNCAAFTNNLGLICESDCPKVLKDLLLCHSESIKVAVTQAISNISIIEKSHRYFQMHIPILLNNAMNSRQLLKSLSLTALANLALDPASHKMIIKHIQPIASMVRHETDVVQLQSIRLLINLSCNDNVIPALLMSEVPSDILKLLSLSCDREILLRLLTFLSNIAAFLDQVMNNSSKATLLSVIHCLTKNVEDSYLMSLSNDKDEEIKFQANRLLDSLSKLC